jgi:hypothetical protein
MSEKKLFHSIVVVARDTGSSMCFGEDLPNCLIPPNRACVCTLSIGELTVSWSLLALNHHCIRELYEIFDRAWMKKDSLISISFFLKILKHATVRHRKGVHRHDLLPPELH